jgi:KDO2-lipid IV(A) lauroyltransferase
MGFKLFLLIEKFLMILPKEFRKSFFSILATIAYYASPRYRNIAYKNLDFAFDGKMNEKEKQQIVRYSFKNLLFNFLHLMEIRHMPKEELANKVSIKNIEAVQKAHNEGRSVIYVTPHYSAWELGGASVGAFIEPITAVFKKMKNLQYQEWMLESRGKFGNKSLEKSNVVKPLIKLIKKGEACGIVIDTGINHREGLEVEFLGKSVRQTSTPAYLARKYNAAIIPVTIRTDDDENYTLILFDEIPMQKTDDESADIQKNTQLQADWLTKLITDEPKFWFWLHRRWKGEHPEIYKN